MHNDGPFYKGKKWQISMVLTINFDI